MKNETQLGLFWENEQTTDELRISSCKIAELTGKKHEQILEDCDELNQHYENLQLPKIKLQSIHWDSSNGLSGENRCYFLTKVQTLDLITDYDIVLRIKVNRRWEELEKQQPKRKLPQTYKEALIELLWVVEGNEKLQAENKLMRAKAEFYDDVMGSDYLIDMKNVAEVLNFKNVGRNELFEFLRNKSILMRDNQPYQKYVDLGYFRIVEFKWFDSRKSLHRIVLKTMVYWKGLEFISKLLKKEFKN